MKRMLVTACAALATAGILCGCQSPKTAGYAARATVLENDTLATVLKVDNGALARALRVASMHTDYTDHGFLRAQVAIVNSGKRDRPCQYKFLWYDESDMEMRPGNRPWEQITFHGGEEARVQAVSPYPEATSFKIQVRPLPTSKTY